MNAEVKSEWLEALRSGKYRRTSDKLRKERLGGEHVYCCLGVLCDILPGEHEYELSNLGLPQMHTLEYAGLPFAEARVLARLNDQRVPFSGIANYIEENL